MLIQAGAKVNTQRKVRPAGILVSLQWVCGLLSASGASRDHLPVPDAPNAPTRTPLTPEAPNAPCPVQDGRTPLYTAAQNSRDGAIQLLLSKGADPDIADEVQLSRWSCPHFHCDHLLLAPRMTHTFPPPTYPQAGYTPLFVAAQKGRITTIRLLLSGGAKQSASQDGRSPLWIACAKGFEDVAQELVAHDKEAANNPNNVRLLSCAVD